MFRRLQNLHTFIKCVSKLTFLRSLYSVKSTINDMYLGRTRSSNLEKKMNKGDKKCLLVG